MSPLPLKQPSTFFKNIARRCKNFGSDPKDDWRILVGLFCFFVFLILAGEAYMFRQVNKGELYISVSKDEVQIDSINRKTLQDTLESFANKKLNFDDAKLHSRSFDDPSI